MSDDSDLLIAAAAMAALFTWMGTLRSQRPRAEFKRKWSKMTATLGAALGRSWRETPGYVFVIAVIEALRRRK